MAQRALRSTEPARPAPGSASQSSTYGRHGQPLDLRTRTDMEARFGHDFSKVRVHADENAARSASSIAAAAYTFGSDITFAANRYDPASRPGRELLAHELAHVVQQHNAPPTIQLKEANNAGLAEIQGLPMSELLQRLRKLPESVLADEEAGGFVGGPRLVVAMRAVLARIERNGPAYLASNQDAIQALPGEQPAAIRRFLAEPEPRTSVRQHQEDVNRAQQAPPLWLSLLGPAAVRNYYRNPAGGIKDPLLQGQADLTTQAAAGGGALATSATAVAAGIVSAATTAVIGSISAPVLVGIGVEAAAGSAVLAPVVGIIFSNPIAATEVALFGAGVVVSIAASGGVQNWLHQLVTPEGALQVALDLVLLRATIKSSGGGASQKTTFKGKVKSANPKRIEVVITEPPAGVDTAAPSSSGKASGSGSATSSAETTSTPAPQPTTTAAPAKSSPTPAAKAATSPEHEASGSPKVTSGNTAGSAAASQRPTVAVLDIETIDSLVKMWESQITANPARTADYQRYIDNLKGRRNLLRSNRPGGVALSGEQSEREIQHIYASRHKRVHTPEGNTIPDATVGNDWAVEVKNWNVLFPTETELRAAEAGRLPPKLQTLAEQVEQRRGRFGDRQTVVIDLRGQLSLTNVSKEVAEQNRKLLDAVGRTVATACKLPVHQIQLVVW